MAETLESAARALDTLLLFNAERSSLGVSELAQLLGCSTSSAQRTINTLTQQRFLRRDSANRSYRLGPGVLQLVRAWRSTASLASMTQAEVALLAADTGYTATFAVADQAHMRAIIAVDGAEGPLRDYPVTGELFPAHVGAVSKAYYAHLPRTAREHFTSQRPLARYTADTRVDPEALEAEFASIRQLGYCVTHGEYDPQVTALAVLVRLNGEPFGSVCVSTRGELRVADPLLNRLHATASAISQVLDARA